MKYDFETLVPARDTDAAMWGMLRKQGITDENAISYGVAEMKFRVAPAVEEAMRRCIDAGSFGYDPVPENYRELVCRWMRERHGFETSGEELTQTYGVVSAVAMAIRAFTEPGDGVVIQSPVYNPFAMEIEKNGRRVVENPLIRGESRYFMDLEDLREKARNPRTTLLVLCSPHNPGGMVWSRRELEELSELCLENGVLVVSDEIHADLVYGAKHTVYASVSEAARRDCVVCTAPSKTFNLPGLATSNIIIPDEKLRERFRREASFSFGHFINVMGVAAGAGAYGAGAEWADELNAYLAENERYFRRLVSELIPQAWAPVMEGTYLAWLDLGFLGLGDVELESFLIKEAQLAVNPGAMYGTGGSGFVRVNIGCPRRYVRAAVERLAAAVDRRRGK